MSRKTTILIPIHNSLRRLREVVASLSVWNDSTPSLFVVDNGSNEAVGDYCKEIGLDFVSLPWEQEFMTACNAGLRIAEGKFVALLKDVGPLPVDELQENVVRLHRTNHAGIVVFEYPALLLIKRELLATVGYLREDLSFEAAMEDYVLRAEQAGYSTERAFRATTAR